MLRWGLFLTVPTKKNVGPIRDPGCRKNGATREPPGEKKADHKETQVEGEPSLSPAIMATFLWDLPREQFMNLARSTPHPCAALMEECYRSDEWFDILERRELRQWAILEHRAVLTYTRDHVKRSRDPIEALAADRRLALQLIGVYEDTDDESLWWRKRARTTW